MSFPKYGELAMNIKRPAGEFQKSIGAIVEELPDYAILKLEGKEFEIQAEAFGYDDNFKPKGVFLYKSSLRSIDDVPIDKNNIQRIIDHYAQYYMSQGLEVKVE